MGKKSLLYFLPFLALYVIVIALAGIDPMIGDGRRYLMFADNLLHGFYSPREYLNLWSGPGYPILLMPFVGLNVPVSWLPYLNAILLFLGLTLFYRSLCSFLPERKALLVGIGIGIYYLIAYRELSIIGYEALIIFLVCALIYSVQKAFESDQNSYLLWLAGFCLGFLALTRTIFGYVILVALILSVIGYFMGKDKRPLFIKGSKVLIIAFLTTLPYLIYTFQLTGRYFYWGNTAGMQLYWMSTPYEYEYGDLNRLLPSDKPNKVKKNEAAGFRQLRIDKLNENHGPFYESIKDIHGVERDDAFKKKAIENIRKHPSKYLKNVLANFGRLFFGIPNSYRSQTGNIIVLISIHSFLLVFMTISGLLSIYYWRKLPFWLWGIVILGVIYFGGSLLVCGQPRYFFILTPIFIFWIRYVLERTITIKWL